MSAHSPCLLVIDGNVSTVFPSPGNGFFRMGMQVFTGCFRVSWISRVEEGVYGG